MQNNFQKKGIQNAYLTSCEQYVFTILRPRKSSRCERKIYVEKVGLEKYQVNVPTKNSPLSWLCEPILTYYETLNSDIFD